MSFRAAGPGDAERPGPLLRGSQNPSGPRGTRQTRRQPTSGPDRVRQPPEQVVYGVHCVRAREICATRFLTADEAAAETYARVLSQDPGVLAAAVTRYILDCEGREKAQALYVTGRRQEVPHVSDDRRVYANGHGAASDWAPK